MQKMIELGQVRPSVLTQLGSIVKNWMESKNEFFSALSGEEFTNGEVLAAHAVCAGLMVLSVMGGAV